MNPASPKIILIMDNKIYIIKNVFCRLIFYKGGAG